MANGTQTKQEPRWTRRKDARPEEITAAALELFVERGFAGTRLDDVAASAGVSKGTVYLYFANKEELFKAVVREGLVSPLVAFKDMASHFDGSMFDLLRKLVHGWWEKVGSTRASGIPKLILAESGNFPELARFYLAEVVEPGHEVITQIIRRGIARGEFRPVDADDTARLVAAPLLLSMMWQNSLARHSQRQMNLSQYLEAHLDVLKHGLRKE
jgi:AcrR family transcriptional regulator